MADFRLFLSLGWVHIWEGYDHLLFLAALLLGLSHWRAALYTVTAFTAGHSVSMVAVATGLVSVSPFFVEAAIALSILAGAMDNLVNPVPAHKAWLAGGFGLIHGAGFSGQLFSLLGDDATTGSMTSVLSGFFIGLEAGQLVFVLVVFGLFSALRKWSGLITLRTELSRAVAAAGLYLFIIRAVGG